MAVAGPRPGHGGGRAGAAHALGAACTAAGWKPGRAPLPSQRALGPPCDTLILCPHHLCFRVGRGGPCARPARALTRLRLLSCQRPSARPRRTPTAGGGPPPRWPPPGSCCAPTVTTTSPPARPTGPCAPPPRTAACRPSCCSRCPARPTGPSGPSAATSPGPAAGPRRSTGSPAPARMASDRSSPGTWGKDPQRRGGAARGPARGRP